MFKKHYFILKNAFHKQLLELGAQFLHTKQTLQIASLHASLASCTHDKLCTITKIRKYIKCTLSKCSISRTESVCVVWTKDYC